MEKPHSRAIAVVRVCLAFALIHSVLASRVAKIFAEHLLGSRWRFGIYRLSYVLLSTGACVWISVWLKHQADRPLYQIPRPWAWLIRAGQAASFGLLAATVWANGMQRSMGITQVKALLNGEFPPAEPEAQGPALGPDGMVAAVGPFRYSRHPGDLAAIGIFALTPRLGINRLIIAIVATLYSIIGALHEEQRQREAYGVVWEHYCQQVPFLIPHLCG